ncbi:hypothetical protein FB451DRAFT_1553577 [Mycena latifolia]|nr:hypothetical protein FB451DRAFT_1553577 [Mycena latifolia]
MTDMVFNLQELCDQISFHLTLHDSSKVELNPPPSSAAHYVSPPNLKYFATVSTNLFHRLSAILTTSPHLIRSIRSLSLLAQVEMLHLIANMQLPLLKKIRLNFSDTSWPDEDALRLSRHWIGLSSIREVEIHDLDSLVFCNADPTSSSPVTSQPLPAQSRIKVKQLQLLGTANLGAWFISHWCPFDFTHLVEVDVDATRENSTLLQVLTSARSSITRLRITDDLANPLEVNFSEFPALTCLEIDRSDFEALSSLQPNNCLERLVLHVAAWVLRSNRPGRKKWLLATEFTAPGAPASGGADIWFDQ